MGVVLALQLLSARDFYKSLKSIGAELRLRGIKRFLANREQAAQTRKWD